MAEKTAQTIYIDADPSTVMDVTPTGAWKVKTPGAVVAVAALVVSGVVFFASER